MLVASWNLNNRVGRTKFRLEAANAATTLGADVLVFNEYYPKEHEANFSRILSDAGWAHQLVSRNTGVPANRVLIASRRDLVHLDVALPQFDQQFPSNILWVAVPSIGVSIVGVRVPWYEGDEMPLVASAWNWLESTARGLSDRPSIILGDLNVSLNSSRSRGGEHFRRLLQSGWHRATPAQGASFFGDGAKQSEIDHILGNAQISLSNTRYVTDSGGYQLAGGPDALSDHAALLSEIAVATNA